MTPKIAFHALSFAFIVSAVTCGLTISAQEFHPLAGAQSKMNALRAWGSLMKKEYPKVDFYHTALDLLYPKLVNLFADEYFVPVFGERIEEVGDMKRKRIAMAIRNCFSGRKEIDDEDRWLNTLGGPFGYETGTFGYDYVVTAVKDQRKKRADYQSAIKTLDPSNQSLTATDLMKYKSMLDQDFANLLPSELAVMESLLKVQETSAANNTVKQLIQQEGNKPNSYQALLSARNFTDSYKNVLKLASDGVSRKASAEMNVRVQTILTTLMETEQAKLAALPGGEDGIKAQNAWHASFMNAYNDFRQLDAVKAALNKYADARVQSLSVIKPSLETRIQHASTISGLEEINAIYLTALPIQNSLVEELRTENRQRQAFLKAEVKKAEDARIQETMKAFEKQKTKLAADNKSPVPTKDTTHYGALRLDELKYSDAWLNIYNGNFSGLAALEQNPKTENVPTLMFKRIIDGYSKNCQSYIPAVYDSVVFYEERYVRSETNYLYNTRTNYYEKYISNIVYMAPMYGYAYRNAESPADKKTSSNVLGALLNVMTGDGISDLQSQANVNMELRNDAWLLINQNGCGHPGIRVIMTNLNEYVKGRR